MQQGYGEGFRHWATIRNLKDMAKTLIYLHDNGIDNYDDLSKIVDDSKELYNTLSGKTKANSNRMKEIAELQVQISNYSRTLEVYRGYRDSKWSKEYYRAHEGDIILHKAAKNHFDSLGLKKLPTMKMLRQEYATLAAENKKLYPEQKQAREKMIDLLMAKQNADTILGIKADEQNRDASHERQRKNSYEHDAR